VCVLNLMAQVVCVERERNQERERDLVAHVGMQFFATLNEMPTTECRIACSARV
jgi:hypothetical protein